MAAGTKSIGEQNRQFTVSQIGVTRFRCVGCGSDLSIKGLCTDCSGMEAVTCDDVGKREFEIVGLWICKDCCGCLVQVGHNDDLPF